MRLNKKILMSFILTVILAVCLLTGCSISTKQKLLGGSEDSTKSPQETGTDQSTEESERDYSGYYVASHDFGEAFSDDTMKLDSLEITFHLTLKKNNQYKLYTRDQEVQEAIRKGLADQLTEEQQEELDRLYSEESITEDIASGAFPVLDQEGDYLIRDNKLVLNPDTEIEKECPIDKEGNIEMSLTLSDLSQEPVTLLFTKTKKK